MNKNAVQILEEYWREHPAWFGRPYGEYLHLGANQEMLRIMLRDVPLGPETRALDVSCGLGGNARWLASLYGATVDGVDRFKPAIVAARQLAKAQLVGASCTFHVQEGHDLPFPEGRFDLALTSEDEVAWPDVARVVKRGGHVVGSQIALSGVRALERSLAQVGLATVKLIDVTAYARAFYEAKEKEARLLVDAELMSPNDLQSLQMYTVDLYSTAGAQHALFLLEKR
jgi:SAM-dependent methyltransferase